MTYFETLLQTCKLTKAQLAKAIGVSPSTVYHWKTDEEVPLVVIKYLQEKAKCS